MPPGCKQGLFYPHLIRDGQFVAAPGATCRYNFTATVGTHTAAEPMLVDSFPSWWLECPFHLW